MNRRRVWMTAAIAIALLALVACRGNAPPDGSQNEIDVADLRAEVAALHAEVATLRGELRAVSDAPDLPSESPGASQQDTARTSDGAEIQEIQLSEIEGLQEMMSRFESLATADSTFTLQILHAADMDSAVGALQNVENFSAILDGFRSQYPDNTIVLSSGDNYVPGPRYFAAGDDAASAVLGVPGSGRGDIALMNAMGFQASAVGNHELDQGAGAFASIIGAETDDDAKTDDGATYPGARFPYLSANLDFAADENLKPLVVADGQEAMLVGASVAASAVVTVGGERIGVVGATTPRLAALTSAGGIGIAPPQPDDLDALAAIIQGEVDALVAQGINKIILLGHMQRLDIEQALASRLENVDVIIGGGSNTLLADETDRLWPGHVAADIYPLTYRSPGGAPVLLVNIDGDYRYLGRLVVEFDSAGHIIPASVDPHQSGAYATDTQGGQAFSGVPIAEVARIAGALRAVIAARDGSILGSAAVYLDGRRSVVRTEESNLGNLTADANLWLARQVDPQVQVSLKNGGGIRDDIGLVVQPPGSTDPSQVEYHPTAANPATGKAAGDISQFDIEGTLRFNNGLVIAPVTAERLAAIMEHAIGFDGVGDVPDGRFPQVGGMRFSFDPDAPAGQRVRSLAVVGEDGEVADRVVVDGVLTGDPDRVIKMVTLNFLANGGDGYPFPVPQPGRIDLMGEAGQPNAPDSDFPDTNGNGIIDGPQAVDPGAADFADPGSEQDALAEYLARFHVDHPFSLAETPGSADRRVQNLGVPGTVDTVFQ